MTFYKRMRAAGTALAIATAGVGLGAGAAQAADRSVLAQLPAQGLGPTYAWVQVDPSRQAETDPRVNNSIVRQRLQQAVDYALQGRGYRPASNPARADFLVAYRVGVEDKTEVYADDWGGCCWGGWDGWDDWGWGWYGPPGDMTVDTVNYTEGTLMIDLLDKRGNLVWRGTSVGSVRNKTAQQDKLNQIASKVLAALPAPGTPADTD